VPSRPRARSTPQVGTAPLLLLLLQPCRDAAQAELLALQGAKQDMELGQAVLIDKLQQCQAENEQFVQHMAQLKARITNSTTDYIDILQHRGEQIKAAEARATSLQQQLQHLQQELAQAAKEVSTLKVLQLLQTPAAC
jgi:chromosome segregation ATPase